MPCEDAKTAINDRIRGLDLQIEHYCENADRADFEDINREEFDFDDEVVDLNAMNERNISNWLRDIVKDAEDAVQGGDDGDRYNLMENRPFAKYFIDLCQMLPIWNALSNTFFNSPNLTGSSWSSETNFKNIKQLHGKEIPCSVDVFVKRDLELNNSTVIDASRKYLTKNVPNPKQNVTGAIPKKKSKPSTSSKSKTSKVKERRSIQIESNDEPAQSQINNDDKKKILRPVKPLRRVK